MTNYPFLLFNQTPESLRRIGSRGGKARARNQRAALRAPVNGLIPLAEPLASPQTTAAEAIAVLDAQFPWLRGAERSSRLK